MSLKNRKLVIVIKVITIDRTIILLLVIYLGKRYIESQYNKNNLKGGEVVILLPTRYINKEIALKWLYYFIKYISITLETPQKILLIDSYLSYYIPSFILNCL